MGNKCNRPESRPKSARCSMDEKMDEATSKAERIRASRGNYEVEVTCTGEAGLHQCLLRCNKNPRHFRFIPTNNFNIEHLPLRYRDNLLVDYAKAMSDLTCRLSVSRISEDRPETWPDSKKPYLFSACKRENFMMVGTGWVSDLYKVDYEECPCDDCRASSTHTPKKQWGRVYIDTPRHVVYNDEEARYTKCHFFYDSPEACINKVPTITGLRVYDRNITGDKCSMLCLTHDWELLDKLDMMYKSWEDLHEKVMDKYIVYWSNKSPGASVPDVGTNAGHDLCIVVSHPHGCTKLISVGTWTHRHVVNKLHSTEYITYSYNTPTCPGSGGAAVITLCKDYRTADVYDYPLHSEGRPGNNNNSGTGEEFFYKLVT